MDLTAIAVQAARIAFDVAGTALETVTLHLHKNLTYDFATDKQTPTGGIDPTVQGLFYKEARPSDDPGVDLAIFMVKGEDAPGGIAKDDTLTRFGTDEWLIYQVDPIPTQAVILLRIRR